jgi:hypothetical protein
MTSRRLKLTDLPAWPRFLSSAQAAAYVGVSPAVFQAEVKSGIWPKAVLRGAKRALPTWDRVMLDEASDRLTGAMPSLQVVTVEEIKRRLRGATRKR